MKPKKKSNTDFIVYAIILIVIAFLSLHLAVAYKWAVENPVIKVMYDGTEKEKFNITGLLEQWGTSLSETPTEIHFNDYTAKVMLISCGFSFIVLAYLATTKRKYISGKEYGSAEWGNPQQLVSLGWQSVKKLLIKRAKEDLKKNTKLIQKDKTLASYEKGRIIKEKEIKNVNKIKKIEKDTNKNSEIILAWNVKFCIYNQDINSNVMIYGGSGAGKSRGIVMPNILNLAGTCSFVVTDPKGEIYQKSKYFLQQMGYKVRCINLFEKHKSSHYNPLQYIHTDRENYDWQEDVLTLIETMIINLDGGEGRKGSDPFWDDSSRHFIQSLFFFTMYQLEEKDRNMNSVMELLGMLEIAEDEDNYDSPLDIAFQMFGDKFGKDNIAYRTYKDFRTKASGKTAKSIAMTMVSKLQPYNIASMQALSSKDEMLLDHIGDELTAVFVIVPPVSKTFNFVAGMLFTQIFQELNYNANALHGGRLPIPVQFIMDEFANTCVIPNFEQIIAYARSLGIGIMPILQSRAQLKGMYEKAWETISDNCASTVFLGSINSEDTLKAFSERLGKGTFDEKSVSVSKGRSSSTSTSNKKIGRELMTPAEIAELPKSDCLVFINGKHPMYCLKYDYPKHERYKYTSDFDDRYLTLFEDEREDDVSPHGEEQSSQDKIADVLQSADNITVDNNPVTVAEYMESKYIGAWGFVSDKYMIVEEGEKDEVLWNADLEEEIEKNNEETLNIVGSMADLYKQLEKERIDVSNDPSVVSEIIQKWTDDSEATSFVSDDIMIVEEGENLEEFYEDDSEDVEAINNILNASKDLETELDEVSQMQLGSSLSLSELFKDELLTADEEEQSNPVAISNSSYL